ncbi:hypothetical protein Ct61P_14543 [Colletotrichum tofieldiae]|nr:hypothetical protein Ct61P_14543 [Colletotrichum tofieldiae]
MACATIRSDSAEMVETTVLIRVGSASLASVAKKRFSWLRWSEDNLANDFVPGRELRVVEDAKQEVDGLWRHAIAQQTRACLIRTMGSGVVDIDEVTIQAAAVNSCLCNVREELLNAAGEVG